jgi:hypothetical protein
MRRAPWKPSIADVAAKQAADIRLEQALIETFPASDPPAIAGESSPAPNATDKAQGGDSPKGD